MFTEEDFSAYGEESSYENDLWPSPIIRAARSGKDFQVTKAEESKRFYSALPVR